MKFFYLFLLIPVFLFGQFTLPFSEQFEGSGTPTDWTDVGSINYDYTTTVLAGSESMFCTTAQDSAYASITASSELYFYFMVNIAAVSGVGTQHIFKIRGADLATPGWTFLVMNDGVVRVYNGSTNANCDALGAPGTYHVWGYYLKGSGLNGNSKLWISSTSTKPASVHCEVTAGNGTADLANLLIHNETGQDRIIDNIYISTTEITGDPFASTGDTLTTFPTFPSFGGFK